MIVFLDAGPLGGITIPKKKPAQEVQAIKAWVRQMQAARHVFIVPAVADYEQRREHTLRGATASLAALDAFIGRVPGRYLPLTDIALKLAAQLWADVRKMGQPTADVKDLDCE